MTDNEEPPSYQKFRDDLIKAQSEANERNVEVTVHFREYSTRVEPNLPPFSDSDLKSRLGEALKGVMANAMGKEMMYINSDDELEELSQSILKRDSRMESPVILYTINNIG